MPCYVYKAYVSFLLLFYMKVPVLDQEWMVETLWTVLYASNEYEINCFKRALPWYIEPILPKTENEPCYLKKELLAMYVSYISMIALTLW